MNGQTLNPKIFLYLISVVISNDLICNGHVLYLVVITIRRLRLPCSVWTTATMTTLALLDFVQGSAIDHNMSRNWYSVQIFLWIVLL